MIIRIDISCIFMYTTPTFFRFYRHIEGIHFWNARRLKSSTMFLRFNEAVERILMLDVNQYAHWDIAKLKLTDQANEDSEEW